MNLPGRSGFAHAVCNPTKLSFSIHQRSSVSDLRTLTTIKLASAFLIASLQNKLVQVQMKTFERDNVIVNTTRIIVGAEHRKELFQTLHTLLDPIRRENGCLAYHFYLEAGNENCTVLIGEWETQEDWDNHLRSDDFAVLLGAITVLSSTSNIDFKILSYQAGLETVMMSRATSEGRFDY